MAQKTTYSKAPESAYDRRTKAERAKERGRIAEAERQASLRAAGEVSLGKVAADVALAKEQNVAPPDPAQLPEQAEQRRAQREADEARLAELATMHNHETELFYRRMETLLAGFKKGMALVDEARPIAKRLRVNNPISTTFMGVGSGAVGWSSDRALLVQNLFDRFVQLYRANSSQILPDVFEGRRGKSKRTEAELIAARNRAAEKERIRNVRNEITQNRARA